MSKLKSPLFPGAAMLAVLFLSACTQRHQNDSRTVTQLVRLAHFEPPAGRTAPSLGSSSPSTLRGETDVRLLDVNFAHRSASRQAYRALKPKS